MITSPSFALSPTFRADIVQKLLEIVRAGESASIIGVSGVGKSNLFNHLLNPAIQQAYTGEKTGASLFICVNFHHLPDFTTRSAYSLILEQLENPASYATPDCLPLDQIARFHEALLDAGEDVLKISRYFKLAIREICANHGRKLVFLFDQFDGVFPALEPLFFANLRGLRESYKYRLSFLLFTRDTLPNLASLDSAREEFYELVASNELGLSPYNSADAQLMLARIAARYQHTFSEALATQLIEQTGGHGGMLRAACLAQIHAGTEKEQAASLNTLSANPKIIFECEKIWDTLSPEEQEYLYQLAHHLPAIEQNHARTRLSLKGLLTPTGAIFSSLFTAFLKNQKLAEKPPIYLDERERLWVNGKLRVLAPLEQKIIAILWSHRDESAGVSRDKLIVAVWPQARGGVSNAVIDRQVSRLRAKIEPDPKKPIFIETLRGEGYRLNTLFE